MQLQLGTIIMLSVAVFLCCQLSINCMKPFCCQVKMLVVFNSVGFSVPFLNTFLGQPFTYFSKLRIENTF